MQYLVLCCSYLSCDLKVACIMIITQELYNKIHLNAVLALIFFF